LLTTGEGMNKSELITALAEQKNLKLDESVQVVEALFGSIKDALASGDRVEVRGFGSFKVKDYKGYKGRNPKTGSVVQVQPKRLPFFRAGKELKEFIND
jgi:integration host factor subunit beta